LGPLPNPQSPIPIPTPQKIIIIIKYIIRKNYFSFSK